MANSIRQVQDSVTIRGFFNRLITSLSVLLITAFVTPNFEVSSISTLMIAATILSIFDYLFNSVFNMNGSLVVRGIIGFVVCATILYITQFFVSGYTISSLSSMMGALIYAIVITMIPLRKGT